MKCLALTAITALSIALAPTAASADSGVDGQGLLGVLLGLGALTAIAKEVRAQDAEKGGADHPAIQLSPHDGGCRYRGEYRYNGRGKPPVRPEHFAQSGVGAG